MEKVSPSHEDYLKAILVLGGSTDKQIKLVDVARKLDVFKASVHKAANVLKGKGLISPSHYDHLTLTEEGLAYSQTIYKRHQYLATFFTEGLGIDRETAEQEACLMEHAISDTSFNKWMTFIERLGILNETRA